MTNITEKIQAALERKFKEAGYNDKTNTFNEITLTMKSTGLPLTLCLCYYGKARMESIMQAEYILVTGPQSAVVFGGEPKEVVDQLSRYDELHAGWLNDKAECEKYFHKLEGMIYDPSVSQEEINDARSFYSDWHKEVFGWRPRGLTFGTAPVD